MVLAAETGAKYVLVSTNFDVPLSKSIHLTGALISPYTDLLPDVFCLMVRILLLMLVLLFIYIYIYIYILIIFLQL